MARPTKRFSVPDSRTKVQAVTSVKLALSVLALGFASLAAALAATTGPKRPDLVINKIQLNYTGYYYNELPVVNTSIVVSNIGNAATPSNRPFRVLLRANTTNRLVCGFGVYGCKTGKVLPETKPGSGVYYIEIPAGYSIPAGGSRLVEFMIGGITSESLLKNFPAVTQLQASVGTTEYFPELNTKNNNFSYKFMTKMLVVKKFNANEFLPDLCSGFGSGYGYGYNNSVGCYPIIPAYSECGYGYGYNSGSGCVSL